jgi:organic hydroperoxide reductase OsmC/OhrA
MTAPYPHHYTTSIVSIDPSHARLEAPPRTALVGGPPPEFGGDDQSWSPEHLLLQAVGLCIYTTFQALAGRESLATTSWTAKVDGVLDKTAAGLAFTSFRVGLEIVVAAADLGRAGVVLERAKRHCIVSNALRIPVEVTAEIRA